MGLILQNEDKRDRTTSNSILEKKERIITEQLLQDIVIKYIWCIEISFLQHHHTIFLVCLLSQELLQEAFDNFSYCYSCALEPLLSKLTNGLFREWLKPSKMCLLEWIVIEVSEQ